MPGDPVQNIIEVLHRSMPAILLQSTHGFEPHDGWWITGVLGGVDCARRRRGFLCPKLCRESAQPLLRRI
jgi:hypothetical protein